MGLFDRIKTGAVQLGHAVSDSATHVMGGAVSVTKENAKITGVKWDLAQLDAELNAAYQDVGKKYVEYVLAGNECPDVGAMSTLRLMEPKLEKKKELEAELARLEKELGDQLIIQERALVQREFDDLKAKLDKAQAMGVISAEDYAAKLSQAGKKLENFDAIRMLKKQKELGIISGAELDAKIAALLQ